MSQIRRISTIGSPFGAEPPHLNSMTDTEILDWIEKHASKLGMRPDYSGWLQSVDGYTDMTKPDLEYTDIRKKVEELAKQ